MPEKDLVQVKLHDLFFGEFAFDLHRQQNLIKLTGVGLLGAQEKVTRNLHRDGTATAGFSTGSRDLVSRGQQSIKIDAQMIPELVVLDRHHGIDQIARNFVEFDRNTAMLAELGKQNFITIIDAQWYLVLCIFEMVDRGQLGNQNCVNIEYPGDQDDRSGRKKP